MIHLKSMKSYNDYDVMIPSIHFKNVISSRLPAKHLGSDMRIMSNTAMPSLVKENEALKASLNREQLHAWNRVKKVLTVVFNNIESNW